MKELPKVGFGTWKLDKNNCSKLVYEAIKIGYRHIDCACDYGNEIEVGIGIKKAINEGICTREELFITSKLWNTYHKKEHVEIACRKSLKDLGLEYFDLYLIHFPISLKFVPIEERYPPEWIYNPSSTEAKMEVEHVPLYQTWEGMEFLVKDNLVREIGICNYNCSLLHDLMSYATIKPKVLQIESHPYLTQENLIKTAKNYGIEVVAFSPLGALSYFELDMAQKEDSLLEHKSILELSQKYEKTPAQILLRWAIQRGTKIIPKSSNSNRMKENIDVDSFLLEEPDLRLISSLNKNKRFNDPGKFCEAAFGTFHSIYD